MLTSLVLVGLHSHRDVMNSLSSARLGQAVSYSREQVVEMMEFLIEYGPPRLYWEPAEVFHKLSCVQLLLQLISIACDWRTYYGR